MLLDYLKHKLAVHFLFRVIIIIASTSPTYFLLQIMPTVQEFPAQGDELTPNHFELVTNFLQGVLA
jgi:hypothetical protein